jgi:membrane-associated protease RseP (regulator of RpoE activity)
MHPMNGNGLERFSTEPVEGEPALPPLPPVEPPRYPVSSLFLAAVLFLATLGTTLAVGTQFAQAFARNEVVSLNDYPRVLVALFIAPHLLLPGLGFAVTLMTILLAHELGHWFACRHHRMRATLPYFIPAPTLIGTLGAFILIRSPIRNRRALFDLGFSGPLVGFIFAVPALVAGILHSKIVHGLAGSSNLFFGTPLLLRFLVALLRPGVASQNLLLHPVARAAWVGLLATALNLLPAGQLDGGHILRAVSARWHRRITLALPLLLIPLGFLLWYGWLLWSVLLGFIAFRRTPPLYDGRPLDRARQAWAVVALLIFLLCFMPIPVHESAL